MTTINSSTRIEAKAVPVEGAKETFKELSKEDEVVSRTSPPPPPPPVTTPHDHHLGTTQSSIHDLLNNNHVDEVESDAKDHQDEPEGERRQFGSILPDNEESQVEDRERGRDIDNPPSLVLDFNVSPSTEDDDTSQRLAFVEEPIGEIQVGDDALSDIKSLEHSQESSRIDSCSPDGDKVNEPPATSQLPEINDIPTPPQADNSDLDDDFGDFVENEVGFAEMMPQVGVNRVGEDSPHIRSAREEETCDSKDAEVSSVVVAQPQEEEEEEVDQEEFADCVHRQSNALDDDFDDFTDFTSAVAGQPAAASVAAVTTSEEVALTTTTEPNPVEFEADFNQFANFENFSQPQGDVQEVAAHKAIVTSASLQSFPVDDHHGREENDNGDDFDDDDFGDFSSSVPVAVPAVPAAAPTVEDTLPPIDISNVDGVLREMFPESVVVCDDLTASEKQKHPTATIMIEMKCYETTALTNGYQWSKSHSNKCLVKCLGIDTRNIVSG